jgi:NADH:ubiquinone oxidoreductase subunit K
VTASIDALPTASSGSSTDRGALDRDDAADPMGRIVARSVLAVAVAAGVALAGWGVAPRHLAGHFDVIGYPMYADFDVNRYFDAFYLIALVFPAVTLITYAVTARLGPLRRHAPRRHAPRDQVTDQEIASEPSTSIGRWGRVVVVGGALGYAVACGNTGSADTISVTIAVAAGWVALVVALTIAARRFAPRAAEGVRSAANTIGALALLLLGARIAASAGVTVTSTGRTEHFAIFPVQIAIAATAVGLGALVWRVRRSRVEASDVDQSFVRYLTIPFTIFLATAFIPGALGPMDTFGEGEYLAAGTRIIDGALPWRDLWLIHGLLDDGLKALVGFAVFGFSRWGATTGITALIAPAYFVASYLFAAYFVRRSWALVAAAAVAFSSGVFVDWDVRYLLLPFVLIALTAALRRPTLGRGLLLVAQSVLVPELTLAVPPLAGVVLIADLYRARGRRTLAGFASTAGVAGGMASTGVIFGTYLLATHSLRGFVDYYRNFGDAHSITGGIPLFVNYAVYGRAGRFGVHTFETTPTGLTTRYAIELVLPLVAILLTGWLITAAVRGGRRLEPEDFAMLGMAGLVVLYFQKSISRGDLAHIGEVFAVTTPLIVALVARVVGSADRALRGALERRSQRTDPAQRSHADALLSAVGSRPLGSLALVLVVAIAAPVSIGTLLRGTPGHLHATVAQPAPAPAVPGAASLGFADPKALPAGLVTNLNRIFTAEAGPHGAVFDLSDAPGVVDFLLARNPASRFYDISLAITPFAQRLVVADLAHSRPLLLGLHRQRRPPVPRLGVHPQSLPAARLHLRGARLHRQRHHPGPAPEAHRPPDVRPALLLPGNLRLRLHPELPVDTGARCACGDRAPARGHVARPGAPLSDRSPRESPHLRVAGARSIGHGSRRRHPRQYRPVIRCRRPMARHHLGGKEPVDDGRPGRELPPVARLRSDPLPPVRRAGSTDVGSPLPRVIFASWPPGVESIAATAGRLRAMRRWSPTRSPADTEACGLAN